MRTLALLFAAAAALAAAPAPAAACSCAGLPTEREATERAAAVFEGRVTRVRTVRSERGHRERSVTFAVRRWRKGGEGRGRTVEIRTGMGGGDCGIAFSRRRSYTVYADQGGDGRLRTGICSLTAPLPDPPGGGLGAADAPRRPFARAADLVSMTVRPPSAWPRLPRGTSRLCREAGR